MTRRLLLLGVLLMPLAGCGEDTHKPERRELGIKDLRLTASVSADTVARGDTLNIHMVAWNRYRAPVDVWFTSSCQTALWIYDENGQDVAPHYYCLAMPSRFHMDPLEERHFDFRWCACGDVRPGRHKLVAGFHALIDDTPHTADPITIEVLAKEENVTGAWAGWSAGHWALPEWEDHLIAVTLEQLGSDVSGTFTAGGSEYVIEAGRMLGTQLEFSVTFETEGVVVEFIGDACGDQILGNRRVVDRSTWEILDTGLWYVDRVK